jgi:hypothetical protein
MIIVIVGVGAEIFDKLEMEPEPEQHKNRLAPYKTRL